jgi:hypothetical protein
VLHEILTGRVMFRAQNDLQKKIDLLAQASAPPSAWNADVPPALDLVVARATARDRNARYTSAADMLADVENYLASFRSSSRAVLKLVRSLAVAEPPPVEGSGERPPADAAGLSTTGGAAPRMPVSAATTRPVRLPAEDFAPRPATGATPPPRVDRTTTGDGHSSSGGRGELHGTGGETARLGGAASAERRRFARGAWQRRLVMVGLGGLCLAVLVGVAAGGRALWGRVSRPLVGAAASPANGQSFVLVTFVSTPAGARIIDGAGRTVGSTPATLPVTPSQIVVSFRFQLEGFADGTASAVPDGDKTITVELKPVKRLEKATRKSKPPKRAPTPRP